MQLHNNSTLNWLEKCDQILIFKRGTSNNDNHNNNDNNKVAPKVSVMVDNALYKYLFLFNPSI